MTHVLQTQRPNNLVSVGLAQARPNHDRAHCPQFPANEMGLSRKIWSGRTSFACHKWSAQAKTCPGIFIVRKIANCPFQLLFCRLFYGCMAPSWTMPSLCYLYRRLAPSRIAASAPGGIYIILRSMHIVRERTGEPMAVYLQDAMTGVLRRCH